MHEIVEVTPSQAHRMLQSDPSAVLMDVRDPIEFAFVGHPTDAINVPYKFAPDMALNPEFLAHARQIVPDLSRPLFLLCRTGQRSLAAANVLKEAGYQRVINISEGFEGGLNSDQQRSTVNGWRFQGLPWKQS